MFVATKQSEDQSLHPVDQITVSTWNKSKKSGVTSGYNSRTVTSCQYTQDVCGPLRCHCIDGKTQRVDEGHQMGKLGSIFLELPQGDTMKGWRASEVYIKGKRNPCSDDASCYLQSCGDETNMIYCGPSFGTEASNNNK